MTISNMISTGDRQLWDFTLMIFIFTHCLNDLQSKSGGLKNTWIRVEGSSGKHCPDISFWIYLRFSTSSFLLAKF